MCYNRQRDVGNHVTPRTVERDRSGGVYRRARQGGLERCTKLECDATGQIWMTCACLGERDGAAVAQKGR